MAYAYSITYARAGLTKYFDAPPPEMLPDATERAVALAIGLRFQVGTFGVKSRDGASAKAGSSSLSPSERQST